MPDSEQPAQVSITDTWRQKQDALRTQYFEDQDRRQREAHEQLRRERHEEALTRANLRGRFRAATFGSFDAESPEQERVLKACQEFVDEPMNTWRVLLLIGPPGSGKTHLGAAMAHATIAKGRGARVMTAREVVRRLRSTWARGAEESEQEVIDDLSTCSLLVLDELGVGFGTDAELTQLLDVVDTRYRECRPLVAISNLTPELLRAALGDRMSDRLREASQLHRCNWPSHRRSNPA